MKTLFKRNESNKKLDPLSIYRKYGIVVILLSLFVLSAMISPNFLKPSNLSNILKQITPIIIIGIAQTILIISGMIDLSAGMATALCMVLSSEALVVTDSVIIGFLVAMLVGMIICYINGILVTVFNLPPFIATLAMMNVLEGVIFLHTKGAAVTGLDKLRWLSQGNILGIPTMIILMLILVIVIQLVLRYTKFGLYMYSIGGNEKASTAAGINVNRNKRLTFVLAGALIGIASVVLAARMMSGQPTVGPGYEFDGITAAIIGGTSFTGGIGTTPGTLVGAIIIGLINNILNLTNVESNWQMVAKGVLIATAVILDLRTKQNNRSQ